ncbi:MAG: hypothetical protein IJR49_05810 [Treponema sp.]|nr:hypothetical protein [Treponema sp.]
MFGTNEWQGKTDDMSWVRKNRNAKKYDSPAKYYRLTCDCKDTCKIPKEFRIPLEIDRRIFTPVPRNTLKWQKLYNMRSGIERVNSRLDNMFDFEKHTIRRIKKMTFRVTIAYILMLAFAIAMTEASKEDKIRSFLTAA